MPKAKDASGIFKETDKELWENAQKNQNLDFAGNLASLDPIIDAIEKSIGNRDAQREIVVAKLSSYTEGKRKCLQKRAILGILRAESGGRKEASDGRWIRFHRPSAFLEVVMGAGLRKVARLCGGFATKDKSGHMIHYDANGRKIITVKKSPSKGNKPPLLGASDG